MYTKEEIIEAVTAELKETYGAIARDEKGKEIETPYIVLGIVHMALQRLESKEDDK